MNYDISKSPRLKRVKFQQPGLIKHLYDSFVPFYDGTVKFHIITHSSQLNHYSLSTYCQLLLYLSSAGGTE